MMKKIKLFNVRMPESLVPELIKTLYSGFISEGPKVKEFEKLFGNFINNDKCLAVNSCTSALTLSLLCSGVGQGDEVITTPMTCLATNMPIYTLGARIIWADIDPFTGNISPKSIKENLSPRTKAVVCVHWGGNPCEINQIQQIVKEYNQKHNCNIKIIEDAAHALGSTYRDRPIGNNGSDFVCFSFQAIKHINTLDGGMVVINNDNDYNRIKKMRWYGLDREIDSSVEKWKQDVTDIGFKMNMNDISATIGISQMENLENICLKHCMNSLHLDHKLSKIKGVGIIKNKNIGKTSCCWIYTLLLDSEKHRDSFIEYMNTNNIECSMVHIRNDRYSIFKHYRCYLPGVDSFSDSMVNIPCGHWLKQDEIDHMETIINIWSNTYAIE